MSENKKTFGKPFKKGQAGGPGRTALTIEQKKLNHLIKSQNGKYFLAKLWFSKFSEVKEIITNKNTRTGELMLARLFEKGVSKADYKIVSFIFDRLGWYEEDNINNRPERVTSIKLNYKE
jgi:hypothetical protein